MGKMKDLAIHVAELYQRNHPIMAFEEAFQFVCTHYDISYWMNYEDRYNIDDPVRKVMIIRTNSEEEEFEVATKIHNQLADNKDYIESRIVLNISRDRDDGSKNEVRLYIFKDATTNPEIAV